MMPNWTKTAMYAGWCHDFSKPEALPANAGLVVFLHPHYGVDGKAWGEKENGHVLPLALGFPFETTIVRIPVRTKRLFCH